METGLVSETIHIKLLKTFFCLDFKADLENILNAFLVFSKSFVIKPFFFLIHCVSSVCVTASGRYDNHKGNGHIHLNVCFSVFLWSNLTLFHD